ncbi:MAG: hypothetical protein J1D87_04670 [Lachnospiraceae bacterium]|nr:hypothetical protein [Lachnospiraceae bacterium]
MKTLVAFFSAESGKTAEKLRPYVQGATSVNAKRVSTADEVKNWLENL